MLTSGIGVLGTVIVELSDKNISAVKLSLSTLPEIPDILPWFVYWKPTHVGHLPSSGSSVPYSATQTGYSDAKLLLKVSLALKASL